jgi:hypothetical protein
VGSFLYINSNHEARWNPPREDVNRDRWQTFCRKPEDFTRCQAHFHYDHTLFLNVDAEERTALRRELKGQRRQVGSTLADSRPGSPSWNEHDALEIRYNAIRREQQALKGQDWTYQHDRRFDFQFQADLPKGPNRLGVTAEKLTVTGQVHGPESTINWLHEEQRFGKKAQGKEVFEAQTAQGKGCLISPAFGVDPRELRNYDHRAATPAWQEVQRSLLETSQRSTAEKAPAAELKITLRSMTDAQGMRVDHAPQLAVTHTGASAVPIAPQGPHLEGAPPPAPPAPAVHAPAPASRTRETTPAKSERAPAPSPSH